MLQMPAVVERVELKAANIARRENSQSLADANDLSVKNKVASKSSGRGSIKHEEQNYLWKSHGSPPGSGIAVVGAAMKQHPFSVFAITVDGRLAEWCAGRMQSGAGKRYNGGSTNSKERFWTIHPRPRTGVRLSLLPSALILQNHIRSFDESHTEITLLVTGDDGSVWARQGHQRKYRWERQRRAPSYVLSARNTMLNILSQPFLLERAAR